MIKLINNIRHSQNIIKIHHLRDGIGLSQKHYYSIFDNHVEKTNNIFRKCPLRIIKNRYSAQAKSNSDERYSKEEQEKLVAPDMRQSPIEIISMNRHYELFNKPLKLEYPSRVKNLRLNNTGFSWEVKIPYQVSMTTALYGAHLETIYRYRLDNIHCHWGLCDREGSEHTVNDRYYSAEIHFVHYNMEKYQTLSKAARHSDGLAVVGVFLDASEDYENNIELDLIGNQLKDINLKGDHTIIEDAFRIENLLPTNKSYWSYQGSITTPPFFESVTWFILKHPIKCSTNQIQKFRNLKTTIRVDGGGAINLIKSNHRKRQPLNGRTIVNFDENSTSCYNSNSAILNLSKYQFI